MDQGSTSYHVSEPPSSNINRSEMRRRLFEAAISGKISELVALLEIENPENSEIDLLGTTLQGNTCLHISVSFGHMQFSMRVWGQEPSLLSTINSKGETPLVVAMKSGHASLALALLTQYQNLNLNEMILKQDFKGDTALHHAIRHGHKDLALNLIEVEPRFSLIANNYNESPMYIAVMRGFDDVFEMLWKTHLPSPTGAYDDNVLHAAVRNGNLGIIKTIMRDQPALAKAENKLGQTPIQYAVYRNQTDAINIMLQADIVSEPPSSSMSRSEMRRRLFEAAISGKFSELVALFEIENPENSEFMLGTTMQGNTCLHISVSFGHMEFSRRVWEQVPSLLSTINSKGETPLVVAMKSGHASLALDLLTQYLGFNLNEMILKQDFKGDTALHHAIRHGHKHLALKLIEKEPKFSLIANNYNESPMYIAVMRGFDDVFEMLWKTHIPSPTGAYDDNVLHAAVRNGNLGIIKTIMRHQPALAKAENKLGQTPIQYAVYRNQTDAINIMLQADSSLGYLVNKKQESNPLLSAAASLGHVDAARKILRHCPDAPDCNDSGLTILHQAVIDGQEEFVEFIMGNRQLDKLINMRDSKEYTALHYAVEKCNPKIVRSLLAHKEIDVIMYDSEGRPAFWQLLESTDSAKSSNWNEVFMLMSRADPRAKPFYLSQISSDENVKSMNEIKAYTKYMSLGAILIATITFAAAFSLPGGTQGGLPVMLRKPSFIAFLISDTLAMCSSISVVFLCISARWEDLEYLKYYRTFTRMLMWFALMTTAVAFATGLYTVLALASVGSLF